MSVKHSFDHVLIAFVCLFAAACGSQQTEVTPTATEEITATVAATAVPTGTPTATPTQPPTDTPTPAPLTPTEIFDMLSPSVAYVETPLGSGSGVLIDEGYLLTNAHVVWPFETVRIVFPDGSEFTDAPVLNVDLMADLAVIGPIETDVASLPLRDGEDQVIGSDVYLLGYPGEVEEYPQPTITHGLISRLREWEELGITFFQSDAAIAGGQSGGILVSEMGEVIGISGFRFTEAGFALVASAADIQPRAEGLLEGADVSGLGDWHLAGSEPRTSSSVILNNEWADNAFLINEPVGTNVEIELSGGDEDGYYSFMNAYGYELVWGTSNEARTSSVIIEEEGPHFLLVYQNTPTRNTYNLKSNHEFARLTEENDETFLKKGEAVQGLLNYPGDIDSYQVLLEVGDRVNIQVDSALIDPYFSIFPDGFAFNWSDHSVSDDDSGGGVFGLNAELTYEVPETSFYNIIVESAHGYEVGGYTITLSEPYDGAPTPIAPTATPRPFESEVGSMRLYENSDYKFSIAYPGEWGEIFPGHQYYDLCLEAEACFSHYLEESLLLILVDDLSNTELEDITIEEYVDLFKESSSNSEIVFLGEETIETKSGVTATILNVEFAGLLRAARFIYPYDGAWINITYIASPLYFEDLLPIIEYSFDSFESK